MMPSFLITMREVIEASLIVATILGLLVKLRQKQSKHIVWLAVLSASLVSIGLLGVGSVLGLKVQQLYSGSLEAALEGILMVVSAIFITWAVFFLHTYFAQYKVRLVEKMNSTMDESKQVALFILVFTAVFREGFEIVLFLSTVYFSSSPAQILSGFFAGAIAGLLISLAFFTATIRMPVYHAFRITSALLIFFAAGLLARGVHEFAQIGLLPEMGRVTLAFLPKAGTFSADIVKAVFGVTYHMDVTQIALYTFYTAAMGWYVFLKNNRLLRLSSFVNKLLNGKGE